uniref:Uncharacterized protein n=1 Tax=Anopheles stephensi TaxID=30069 RepID=A0A182YI29_ANOST
MYDSLKAFIAKLELFESHIQQDELSNTVVDRVCEIAENMSQRQISIVKKCLCFSLAVGESTDIRGIAQVALFFRACSETMEITEALLELISLHDTTTGDDIYRSVWDTMNKYDLPFEQLITLLRESDIAYQTIPYYTEHENNKHITALENQFWLQDLAFLTAITRHLNGLNLKLQEKNQLITNMLDSLKAFIAKLELFESHIQQDDLSYFSTCARINENF